jgi:multiple sugar transport system substrate-binding protein
VREVHGAVRGGYTGPPVTISFWNGFTGGDGPAMRRLVTAFNDSHDRILVEQNTVRWEQFYQRVVAAVHAGKGPDVGALHLEQMGTQAGRQTINRLDDVVEELGLRAEEYPANVWQAGSTGTVATASRSTCTASRASPTPTCSGARPPQQPADAAGMAATMTALQQAGVQNPFWVPNAWPAHLIFLSLLWQHGGEPYALDGSRATFDSDAGIAALSWMREQVDVGFSPPNVAEDSQYTAFKNRQVAFTWDGIWQINDLQTNAPDLPWSLAPLPRIGDQAAVLANSHPLVLFRGREPPGGARTDHPHVPVPAHPARGARRAEPDAGDRRGRGRARPTGAGGGAARRRGPGHHAHAGQPEQVPRVIS